MEKSVYCTVRWSNHSNNVNRFLSVNYAEEKYTDVALACDGHVLKAHKMILAGCSPYFENLFSMYNASNLCIAIEGIAYPILQLVLEFMYSGEIRVKHCELENLVKAGVQLKVKGLDAIKLNDLTRGGERTTVIARPTDGNMNQRVVKVPRPVPPSRPKSPPKPSDPVPPPNIKSPPRKMEPLHVQQERINAIQKPLGLYGQHPAATSTPLPKCKQEPIKEQSNSAGSPSKQKPQVVHDNDKLGKEELPPASSPSKPGALSSESKRKVGEWLDSLVRPEKKQESEAPAPEPQTRQTRKRVTNPRAIRAVKGAKVPRAVKRLRGSNGVEGDDKPVEPSLTEQDEEDESDPVELLEGSLSPLKSTPVKTIPGVQNTVTNQEREESQIDPLPRLKEEVASAMDSEEPEQDEVLDAPPPAAIKSAPEKATTTRRARTIKKPARMADAEFEFDTEVVNTKKRRSRSRSRKMEEVEEESAGGESVPEGKSTPVKRRKASPFILFSNDFRAKLGEEYPGESRKEISKRLGILWQNLDQATKDKYQDTDSKSNRDK